MVHLMSWDGVEERTIIPGFHGRFISSERMTFVFWRLDPGAAAPEHSHPHEQVVHVYSGELEFVVDGSRAVLKAGDVLHIPSNVRHSGTALSEVRVMDVFSPVCEDYRGGFARTVLSEALASG
jgi:quercetin dioxygenase-like cupin family protein